MLMSMLERGGMPLVVDKVRKPDEDNPKGYFEFERVKRIEEGDVSWLVDCYGKAIKIVSPLLEYLPSDNKYKVIFMRRKMEEILASQKKMLLRLGQNHNATEDVKMVKIFEKHLRKVEGWLSKQPNIEVLKIMYSDVIDDSNRHSKIVNRFLGGKLDWRKMAQAVESSLYRQRRH
jgi:hypothetical protein